MFRHCILWAFFFLLIRPVWAEQKDPPKKAKGKITIGKDTTVATGPLDKDGYIDYGAALNERLRGKIKPENNAVVLLCEALGPFPEGARMPKKFYEWLQIQEPAKKGAYFVGQFPYMKKHMELDPESTAQALQRQFDAAGERPWKTKQFPVAAGWLTLNEESLARVQKVVRRPEYYYPLVTHDGNRGGFGLIGSLIPGVQRCRELAHYLEIRAMWHLGEGRFDEAWQDILTCHRLGRLVARGGTLIEGLVGVAIDHIAHHTAVIYLDHANVDGKRIQTCLRDLQALPPLANVADKLDLSERFLCLETVMMVERLGVQHLKALLGLWGKDDIDIPQAAGERFLSGIDWDPALRKVNRWMDRLTATLRLKEHHTREKQLDQLEAEMKQLRTKVEAAAAKDLKGEQPSAQARGELAGDVVIALLTPALRKVTHVFDRNEQFERVRHVAFALVAYHREHKAYPKQLSLLSTKYIAEIPSDLYSGKGLLYRPSEKGFVVYSVGPNGRDDGGQWLDDNPAGDDPRVRLPLTAPR